MRQFQNCDFLFVDCFQDEQTVFISQFSNCSPSHQRINTKTLYFKYPKIQLCMASQPFTHSCKIHLHSHSTAIEIVSAQDEVED